MAEAVCLSPDPLGTIHVLSHQLHLLPLGARAQPVVSSESPPVFAVTLNAYAVVV